VEEYLVDVIFDGKKEQLKTYSASPLEALDSMIGFEEVSAINNITRLTDKKNWSFDNEQLTGLRELRDEINNEGDIMKELRSAH
tara:strand:+ start:162 stop:413 length:252 start_codon:yes stop_codon:yes gene_type:complete